MTNTDRPWGYMHDNEFRELPKRPMELAGYGPPPFDVRLPTGVMRHVIEKPEEGPADGM